MINLARSCRLITKNQRCNCQSICATSGRKCIRKTYTNLSSEEDISGKKEAIDNDSIDDITEPTNCCMSGCANCVWIQYAERLSATLEKSDVDVQKLILDKIQDPNMKAFLLMELRFRNLIKD